MKLGYTAAGIFTPVIFIGLLTCRKRALENAVHAAADNSSEAAQTAKTHNDDEVKKEDTDASWRISHQLSKRDLANYSYPSRRFSLVYKCANKMYIPIP